MPRLVPTGSARSNRRRCDECNPQASSLPEIEQLPFAGVTEPGNGTQSAQFTCGWTRRFRWRPKEIQSMLHYAIVFLIIALIAGAFGFFGVAGTATQIAQVLFFLFLILFVASLLMGRRTTPV
jgi:uncharacterized membrane protein YtjA (UPF0391 family)